MDKTHNPDIRETLGLPPVDPSIVRRFGPPTYTEEQIQAYVDALSLIPSDRGNEDQGSSGGREDAALRATEGLSSAGWRVPPGWIMAPADPTPEMLEAGEDQLSDPISPSGPDGEEADWISPAQGIWWRMWEAGPSPAETKASSPTEGRAGNLAGDDPLKSGVSAAPGVEGLKRLLEQCAETMAHLAKGVRGFHEEDGEYMECPSCRSWVGHYGHPHNCELMLMQRRIAKALEALSAPPSPDSGWRYMAGRRAFVMSEPHLSGFRVCVGFESRDDANAFHEAVAWSPLPPPPETSGADGKDQGLSRDPSHTATVARIASDDAGQPGANPSGGRGA